MSLSIAFVCQAGDLEAKALLLAASLRRALDGPGGGAAGPRPESGPDVELIACLPTPEARFGRVADATRAALQALGVRTESIRNPLADDYPIGNKLACFDLPTTAACRLFLDSDVLLTRPLAAAWWNAGIAGTVNITKTGSGTLTLAGTTDSAQANTTVSAGQLNVNYQTALGTSTGTLSMAAGTTLGNTSGTAVSVSVPKSISLGSSLTFVGPAALDLGTGTTTLTTSATISVSTGTLTLGGNIVGSGLGITKTGGGVLVLGGLTTGAYTGNTTISNGELFLAGSSVFAGGTSTIVTVESSGTLRIGASASLGGVTISSRPGGVITTGTTNANITFTQSGTLTASDANINGTQTINGGVLVTAPANWLGTIPASPVSDRIIIANSGSLQASSGFTLNANQGILLQSGTGSLGSATGQTLTVPSTVSGSGALLAAGPGDLTLTGSNSYSGGTIVTGGSHLNITADAALGSAGVTLSNGSLVATGSNVTVASGRNIAIAAGTTGDLAADAGRTLAYSGTITQTGAIGSLSINAAGSGTVALTGANTYAGATTIVSGVLTVPTIANGGQASPIGQSSSAAANLAIGNGTLQFTGSSGTTDRLFTLVRSATTTHNSTIEVTSGTLAFTATGTIGHSGTGQQSLTLTGSGVGSIAASIGNDSGNNATEIWKTGSGRWTLSGNNGYTGDTHVTAGKLVIDGTNQTSNVIVAAGATLGGHGTAASANLSGNGFVEPGDSPGILTFAELTASGSLSFAFEFTQSGTNGVAWSSATASNNDVLRLTDTTSPFNTNLTATNVIDIYINVAGPLAVNQTFIGGFFTDRTVDFSASVQNADFNIWVRPRAGQSATRTYNGVEYVAGDEFFNAPGTFQVAAADFSSGTVNNGYTLQFVAVPEPSTWALGAIGVVGLVAPRLLRRRRVAGR